MQPALRSRLPNHAGKVLGAAASTAIVLAPLVAAAPAPISRGAPWAGGVSRATSASPAGVFQPAPAEGVKILPSDGAPTDYFGGAVAVDGDTAFIGAILDDDGGENTGSVYVFERSGGAWTEVAKLTASNAQPNAFFGRAVAVSGAAAIVGASHHDAGETGSAAGTAYVFERVGGQWVEVAALTPRDGTELDFFGYAVSISGTTAVVGAYGNDDDGDESGSAYVFEKGGDGWVETAKITASEGAAYERFGDAVSISGDTILISARGDDAVAADAGAVYVFEKRDGEWVETAKITASDGAETDLFGYAVSLSGDTALIGARGDDLIVEPPPAEEGAAPQAQPAQRGGRGGQRGGGRGGQRGPEEQQEEEPETLEDTGAAYVFERRGGQWFELGKLTASDPGERDLFGASVSISPAGDFAVVGAMWNDDDGTNSGSAYVFEKVDGVWQEIAKLTAPEPAEGDVFGVSVAASDDTLWIGAHTADDNGVNSGAVWAFDLRDLRP